MFLSDKLFPIGSEIGFLKCDVDIAVKYFINWQNQIQRDRKLEFTVQPLQADSTESVLLKLLPLTNVERRRMIFIDCKNGWTAYVDNGWRGSDVYSVVSFLSETIGCSGVRSCYIPHTPNIEQYGTVIFELYSAERTDFINILRSVAVSFDGYKWSFSSAGELLDFESSSNFESKLIKNKFTRDMLKQYLGELGIDAFDESFFNPHRAFLVEKKGPAANGLKEYIPPEMLNPIAKK